MIGTAALRLCYIWHPHGTKSAAGATAPGTLLLPNLRRGNHRSSHLRRLLRRHLSSLRHSAGITRRAWNGI